MTMQIETTRFGRIDVPDEALIRFPRGLYGMTEQRDFCLLQHDEPGLFSWLQAARAPAIAMVVTSPFSYFPTYEVVIPDEAAELLQASASTDVAVYTSITVAPDRQEIYTNLLGPLLINHRARVGMQLILDSDQYSTRHRIGGRDQEPGARDQGAAVLVPGP